MRRTRFSSPEYLWLLTSPTWTHCEGLIQAFEEAWQQGQTPAIDDYLRIEGLAREALLVELLHVDLEFRLQAGEAARVEGYLATYPELSKHRRAMLDLITAEYELRRLQESTVGREEYRHRFPDYHDELLSHLTRVDWDTPPPGETVAPAPAPWPVVEGYEILEEIGRGGMGVVYKARETSLGRHVALKFLPAEYTQDSDRLERFLREARTASALNHPHICTVHALGEHEGRPFIVMEYIEGVTLHSLIAQYPKVDEVVRLIGQAARALAAAHAAGVVHRDIKPENVMMRADGYVKVLDFGLARRLPTLAEPGAGRTTDPGVLLGTAAYMSPEQTHSTTAESASDVFSLGIVLYQLATGQHPFEAESVLDMVHAIAKQEPIPPSRWNVQITAPSKG